MNSIFVILDSNQNEIKRRPHFVNTVEEDQDPKLYIEPPKSWLEQFAFIEPIIEPFESIILSVQRNHHLYKNKDFKE